MYQTAPADNEQRVKAMIFTTGIVVFIVLLLMFVTLYRPDPLPSEVILELSVGDPYAGGGGGGSSSAVANTPTAPQEEEASSSENIKEAPIVSNKPNNNKPNPNTNTKPDNTKPINNNALFPGMNGEGDGKGDGKGDGEGDGTGNGTGGGNGNGNGKGDGSGFKPGVQGDHHLEGRQLVSKPAISENFTEEGKVFVNVWVDQNGNVTRTSINESKTNTSSTRLRSLAEKAARKIKWDVKPDAPADQKGYYIFNFVLK